ncbi:uncharacterized protein BDR25DRAFT_107924 [Lindgomyces ingoldianus]|uniref:Uncharacterized protein n=1 Tax=Lindgomyces ingoldianus TaxID=673940 RepID=A0ACB6QBH5_9PLEO|nr:uncharacterized protein BDR25DRAFT_107924 [Lindgomyces ingoldianus]KAF2463506.1 hypothetical protein BDR25DRAFT_107924 [Lindgomyces ingoldianus]
MMRKYATVAARNPSLLQQRGKSPLGLDHFLQRQRALALWRDIMRSTAGISDAATKRDMQQFARAEFERHRNVTDLSHIRYLISTGKTQFDTMKNSLINAGLLT